MHSRSNEDSGYQPRILIVEREAIVAEDLRIKLEDLGWDVLAITDSGMEAVEIAREIEPDVLMLDVRMESDTDGQRFTAMIQNFVQKPVPIVFLTSYIRSNGNRSGDMFLKKPFSDDELMNVLEKALKLRREE